MRVERVRLSVSQFCELIGVDPDRLIAVQREGAQMGKKGSTMVLILEPEETDAEGPRDHA